MKDFTFFLCNLLMATVFFQACQESKLELMDSSEASICDCLPEIYSTEPGSLITYGSGEKEITLTHYDGINVFQGDILLTEEQIIRMTATEAESGDSPNIKTRSTGRASVVSRWPNKVVPYVINGSLPSQSRVTNAIAHWESYTDFDFVPRTNQQNYIEFVVGSGCSSYVGMIGGRQTINLASGCTTGNVIHEIGHAIGLWHEHTRADRSYSVNILWNNIQDGAVHNFEIYNLLDYSGYDWGTFDFNSIMLYDSYAFSNNGQPTITKKDGSTFTSQRSALSSSDISGAEYVYSAVDLSSPQNVIVSHDGIETLTMTWNPVPGAIEYWIYTLMPGQDVQPKLYRITSTNYYEREMKLKYIDGYRLWVSARDFQGNTSRAIEATWQ